MDDVLVLAPTRWKLRHAVRVLNETLAALGLEKHPDKTFIGRTEKGFDFLGYRFSPKGILLARQTWERFAVRRARLQERERTGRSPPGALGLYVRRWRRWTSAGLGSMETTGLADAAEWGLGGGFSGVLCATPPSEPCQANRDQ
jgi:RNA-directed DNA polymerase